MSKEIKPVFVFPLHSPTGRYSDSLLKNMELLKQIFSRICISATTPTVESNNLLLDNLEKEGCLVYRNKKGTTLGDHFRNGLKLYLENPLKEPIYYGFIDRVLFALETKFRKDFIKDVAVTQYKEDLVIFSRSEKAWKSHSSDYRILEKMVTEAGEVFINKKLDWTWCGALLNPKLAELILKKSKSDDFAVLAEFILINNQIGGALKSVKVDWLAWEDPFWAKRDKTIKAVKKYSNEEKLFRLKYNVNSLKLFLDYFG